MLSQLSKGYGSWTAGYVDPYFGDKKERECTLPEIDQESHSHGVTVGPRSGRSTAMSWVTSKRSREPTIDGIPLPKTYTTRKGALQLYVGPDDLDDDDDDDDNDEENELYSLKPKYVQVKRPHGQELIDLSLKLGTMERLAMSVLQFGDEDYDHEHTSVTDSKNKAFLKFLHSVDEAPTKVGVDSHVQPGGDLKKYLKDLKTKAGARFGSMYVSKSRESLELQAILRGLDNSSWPLSYSQDGASEKSGTGQFTRPVSRVSSRGPSPGPPSTPRSSYQVLSAKKVAASIRSGSYLGRPSSRISVVDDDMSENEPGRTGKITPPSIMRTSWTPTDSTDDFLIDTREKFFLGDEDGESSEDGRKRRRFKERTFLTNNSQLYQGRNAQKGEGQCAMEVKVVNKGDGDSLGHKMSQIEEELGDHSESKKHLNGMTNNKGKSEKDFGDDEDSDNDTWAVNVSNIKQINLSEQEPDKDFLNKRSKIGTDVELNNKNVIDPVPVKLKVRPQSAKSDISNSSSVSTRSASTRAMSIITLQSMSKQHNNKQQNNFDKYNFSKRKGTYTYDPDKGLVRSTKDRQKSEPFIGASSNSSHSLEASNILYNQNKSPSVGKTASLRSDDTDGRLLLQLENNIHQNVEPGTAVQHEETLEMDNVEAQQTDQEDYVLDNIDECNEEIQQIEAQANATDQESDSDSCMDEEVIKVILEGQKNNDIVDEDQHDFERVTAGENFQDDQIQSEEMVTGQIRSRSSYVNDDERNSAESRSYTVNGNVSRSRSSEVEGDDGKIMSEDILSNTGDELENIMDADDNETVDEIYDENVSEAKSIRSTKSGRKSQSKKTKSVLESEDGGDEYKLPVLESDRLMEKDGINSEDIQTANGEQTGFSGSSVSYSDILVDDKLSELEIVSQSRNSSTQKLSRPSSVILDEDVPQGELDHIENTSSKPDQADEMSDNGGSDKDYANAEENERNHDESALLKNEGSPIEDVDDKQTDKELSALEKEDLEKEVDNVVSEIDQTQSPEALQLEENVEQSEDDLIVAKVEMKVLVEIEGKDRLDEAKADAPDKSVIEESSLITELKTSVPDADVTPPIAEKDEPEIKTTVESPQVIEKKQEAQKQMKTVTDNLENKSTVPKTTLKTEQKPVKTSKSGNAGKTSVVAGNKNGYKTKSVAPSGNKLKTKVSNQDNTSKTEEGVKPKMGSAVLEGEGLLNLESELASKVDEEQGEGLYYDADLDDNARTGEKDFAEYMSDAHAIAAELDALGLTKTKKGSKVYPLLPPGQRPKAPPEKQKIPDHLQDALNRRASESRQYLEEDLERMTAMVGETLSGPTLEAVGEGLTEEELEIAKQILQQKLDEAKGQLDGKPTTKSKGKKGTSKGGKKAGKKKNDPSDDKTKEEIDREAIRARHDHEKQIREQEAADLQRKIAENKRLLKQQADQSSSRSKELLDEMERLEREAADMQQAEDEARQILADERKKQREEREARRKADLERKKQEALDRREREKKEMDDKRRKEMEMMEKIADAEMRRRMREEEERRLDEEERLAQERYEAEMREAQKLEEEEEERLKEMERQAEEEAMQRLIEEREAAERERRRIREEEEAFREAEMRRMEKMAEEHRKLEEERKRLQDIEDAKREAERQNLLKLRQLEEEARIKMQEEIEKRRNEALARRDFNLENKQNVDKLRHYQGITRAWTFSYFVHWPRETYESRLRPKLQKGRRPIGSGDPRKVKIKNPPPKKVDENAAASNTEVPTAIVP